MGKPEEYTKTRMRKSTAKKKHKRTIISNDRPLYDEVEEKQNNAHSLIGLKPWEKKHLHLLQWSYVHQGHPQRVKGCLNLLEPVRCEETLVRIDQDDVRAVLKIMGHNWRTDQKRGNQKKRSQTKEWGTKALDELVVSVSREEDELVRWWKNPYCQENVRKNINQSQDFKSEPLFFKTYDVDERLWAFAERMRTAARRSAPQATQGSFTAGSKPLRKKKKNGGYQKKVNHR